MSVLNGWRPIGSVPAPEPGKTFRCIVQSGTYVEEGIARWVTSNTTGRPQVLRWYGRGNALIHPEPHLWMPLPAPKED